MTVTLTAIRETITRLQRTQKDIQTQRKEIEAAIIEEQRNLSELSGLNITLEDHVENHDKYVKEMESALRQNIQNYLKGDVIRNEPSAGRGVRPLDTYLRRFGLRSSGGNEIYPPYILACGSWKKLRELVESELLKIDKDQWGPWQSKMRAKKTDQCRTKIDELKAALKELEQ